MNKITVKLEDIKAQTQKALVNHGASERVAESVAEAVKVAEAENNKSNQPGWHFFVKHWRSLL